MSASYSKCRRSRNILSSKQMRMHKCRRIQKQVCVLQYKLLGRKTAEMQAHTIRSASKLLLFGLGGLSTLLSFSARLKFSFLFSFSPSEGVAPPPSGPQVGSVHKSAQLIWAACLPYWHGWWYWHAMTKTCQNVGTLQNVGGRRHFDHFSEEKSKS